MLPLWAGKGVALTGVLLVALNIRTAVSSISPIAREVSVDIPLDEVGLSLLGMVPPIAFALSGFFATRGARRFGLEKFLLVAVVLMFLGLVERAVALDYTMLLAGNVIALVGAGVGNVLLPPVVKRYFPDRIGLVTAYYSTAMSVSTAVPAAVSAPIADAVGWRGSLGFWALIVISSAVPWAVMVCQHQREKRSPVATEGVQALDSKVASTIWRSSSAWGITAVFAVSAFHSYAILAWMPEILVQKVGVASVEAGMLLGILTIMGVPAALIVPIVAARIQNVTVLIHAGLLAFVLGYLGLIFFPVGAPVLWVLLIGSGILLFSTCLVLINLFTRTQIGAIALSGFVQGIGYIVGSLGPLSVGILRNVTGEWNAALFLLVGTAAVCALAALPLRRRRYVEDEISIPRLTT